ncbi:MAG: SAGA-associated factor 29 family protein [Janthinobacterium lividum]
MGKPGEKFITSAAALIPIPSTTADLPEYPVGKAVLARYPETTTFYRAEVIANLRKDACKLRFEDDQNQEMEVARRFVLNLDK